MADSLSSTVRALFSTLHSKSAHRGTQAAQLASDLYTLCVESVSDTEIARCTSILFSKDKGIIHFLRESATLEEFAASQEQLLNLLESYIKAHKKSVVNYAVEIKEVCNGLFSRSKSSKVKNAIFPPLVDILRLCSRTSLVESLNVPKLADKFLQACFQPTKHTSTVRGGIFQLLGTLCEVYPEFMTCHSERLIDIFMRTLKSEMGTKAKKKPDMPVIGGCLRGLCSYLVNFSQSVAEGSIHAQDIYKFARMAIDPAVSHTRYEVPRAGLSLIAAHAAQFKEYLAKDHEHMYQCITDWSNHNNRENRGVAHKALAAFFQQVAIHVKENASKDKTSNFAIFKYIIQKFRAVIDNKLSGHVELALAIQGYGYFAAPCKIFMKSEDVDFMFNEMVQRTEQLFFSPVESVDNRFLNLPSFLAALASIINEMDTIPESFILSLEKLLVLLFECYPHLPQTVHDSCHVLLLKTIVGVSSSSRVTLKTFLSHIIFQGMIVSCSHPLVLDTGDEGGVAYVEENADALGRKTASYQDYVDLWVRIMDPTKIKGQDFFSLDPGTRKVLHQIIYDEFIAAIFKVIHRLDLSSKSEPSSGESPVPEAPGQKESSPASTMTSELSSRLQQPSVPKDFHIFINLVDLCKAVLPKVQASMFEEWVYTYGHEMITFSSLHPLVSGFHKLLSICFKMCEKIDYFKDIDVTNELMETSTMETGAMEISAMETNTADRTVCFILFQKFIKEVLVRMKQYKDDLLASCLQLLLSLPKELVQIELDGLVPALQTTFKLGLSYLPLAHKGLDALKRWSEQLPAYLLKPHFQYVLPHLDDYLRTMGTSSDPSSSEPKGVVAIRNHSSRGRKMPVKIVTRWKEGMEGAETPLGQLRKRIVYFLGSLGGEINSSLVEVGPAADHASKVVAWDSRKWLEFALPFQDMKPSIFLDSFLPRVCELATSSSDRQTKIAACELLHALILFVIGKSAQPAVQKKSPMTNLYKKLFPYVFQLGCDVERVAEQLFRPLVFQMIHWFTRNVQYESPDTIALLDAILDGIVHPTDSSLRDFSATCVKEFLTWSIKQTSKKQQEKSPVNTKSLLKRIYSLALHPSAAKRLGAALAINSIYTIFREEESLVDVFVVEMLINMMSSLKLAHADNKSLGTQEQICQAIGHIARIICVKAPMICTSSKTRRVPKVLKAAELQNVVGWLLAQCGSPETACRTKSRELFCELACHLPKIPSERVWIRKTLESEGGLYFISRFERGGQGRGGIQKQQTLHGTNFSLVETIRWLETVTAAVDCYNWVLGDNLLSPNEVFLAEPSRPNEKPSCLFECLEFFASKLALHGLEVAVDCFESSSESVLSPREVEDYNRAKCDLVMNLIELVGILVDYHRDDPSSFVPVSLWSEEILKLLALSCLHPSSIGFEISDIKTMEKLSKLVIKTLTIVAKGSHETSRSSLLEILSTETAAGSSCDLIGQLPLCLHGDTDLHKDRVQLNNTISGHLILHKAGLLLPLVHAMRPSSSEVVSLLLASVVETMKPLVTSGSSDSTMEGRGAQGLLSPANERTTGLLLKLALEMEVTPQVLINHLLDLSIYDSTGQVANSSAAGLGLLLYHSFPALFNNHFVSKHEVFLSHLLNSSSERPENVSAILSCFLEHIHREKSLRRKYSSKVTNYLLSYWSSLSSWWGLRFVADWRLAAINLLKKLFVLNPELLTQVSADSDKIEPVFSMYITLLKETESSLTFKSKILDVLHHFASLSDNALIQRLKDAISHMITKQFPLKSSEFQPGSPQYNEYISCIEKILRALVLSGSLVLLEIIISFTCREARHIHEDRIQSSLLEFLIKLGSSRAKTAIDVAYHIFTSEQGYPSDARRAAGERVCLPLLRSCDVVTLREFFLDHVCEIMGTLEANLSKSGTESHLISKLCCFQIMGVLFSRLPAGALSNPESSINKAYCRGQPKTGKELTQAITKASHGAKSEDLHGDKSHYELRRQYHCAAYNALMAVISCTQKKMQFYHGFLFKEDTTKGQFLWENLVDLDKKYYFETELERPLQQKKQLTTIRDEIRSQQEGSRESSPLASPPFAPRYLSSQYLADSSLSTDVSQFDFSTGIQAFPNLKLSPEREESESSYLINEEEMEQDELNLHECMLPLMKLLDHMEHNEINPQIPSESTSPDTMPMWMGALHKKFSSGNTHQNTRIFLARLIINRPKVFQPYAKFWLTPLIQLIVGGNTGGVGLHYFVVDLMVTILSWSSTAVMEDTYLANRLLSYLMEHCSHHNRSILRNNLEIVKTLVESWKLKLQPSTKIIFDYFGSGETGDPRTGIQLLGIVVANGMPPYDPVTSGPVDEQKFFVSFASLMSHKTKEVYAAGAEVAGLILAYMDNHQHLTLENFKEVVVRQLMTLASDRTVDKFLICLHKIQLNFNKLTDHFVEKLLFLLPNFHGIFRSMCLEVLVSQTDIRPKFYIELRDKGLNDMLTHRDEPTQTAALEIVQGMVQHQTLNYEELSELLPFLTQFGNHSSETCRRLMYEILIVAYGNIIDAEGESPANESLKALLGNVRDQLLQGLSDETEAIRIKMFGFWNEESRLSSDTLGRLTQLLAVLYSTNTERQFLQHATNLLLELTSRSPDFNRSVFDSPLSECKFEEYTGIDLSWQQRNLQMTPLFAATQASQSGISGDRHTQSVGGGTLAEGALRATQKSLAFTPTQEGGEGYNWMTPTLQSMDPSSLFRVGTLGPTSSQDQSSLLFKKPGRPIRPVGADFGKRRLRPDSHNSVQSSQEDERKEIMKLKRRFIKDRKLTSSYFAQSEARKRIMREEHRKRQRAARDSQVVMYRKYRVGELPDIQIKYSELIRPFQALAQRDNTLARMLFSLLYQSVFQQVDEVLTESEAEATKKAIKEGLNVIMESSTQFHPPFIGSLQEVCYQEEQLQLEPAAASRASLMSMQEPIGIMLLEKQLLSDINQGYSHRSSAKKARGAHSLPQENTPLWVELAKLYKSLGDYDAVRGIFSSQVGTKPVTRDALEAEERGEYHEALRLYREAIDCEEWKGDPPTQVEEDMWYNSVLSCHQKLTDWEKLEAATVINIDESSPPKLDKIWEEDSHAEQYLSHLMQSKVKLACCGKDDANFSEFLDNALADPKHQVLLESKYSAELALYSIVKGNHDRASYYSNISLHSFLSDWSDMDKLLVNSRTAHIQKLQALTEIQEYIKFMSDSANFESKEPVECLMRKWQSRSPHPQRDAVSVWDDVVVARCMMMRNILQHFHTLPQAASSMNGGEGGGYIDLSVLKDTFTREYTRLYLKMADSARLQNNYDVATKYLHLTEAAITEHFPSDIGLHLEWIHSVAHMRIQQAQQDPSPSKINPMIALVERFDGYESQSVLGEDHALGRRHHLLEGMSFNLLAKAFSDEGALLLEVLPDDRMKQLHNVIKVSSSTKLTPKEISHKLLLRTMASLKSGIKSGTAEHKASGDSEGMVQALVELAAFCDRELRLKEDEDIDSSLDDSKFPSVVVAYTLKAMQFGSKAATRQVPRLLQIVDLYPDTMENFKKKSKDVPCWMFISWINQLVALLDKPEGPAIHDILFSIASDYPQALSYPLKISSSDYKFDSTPTSQQNSAAVERLKAKIGNKLLDSFVSALELLCSPELVLKDFLENELRPVMEPTVSKRNVGKVKQVWEQLHNQLQEWEEGSASSLYGEDTPTIEIGQLQKRFAKEYNKLLTEKFGRDGSKLHRMDLKDYKTFTDSFVNRMRPSLSKSTGSRLLKDYSPWLSSFQANQYPDSIEIPGQYDGKGKPLPQYHVKISSFDEKVLVMSSIRKPKRITIRGNDEKEYMFLVKGGEDLRLDQRIEQLYCSMNEVLDRDPACSQRGLCLRTYQVIPMTPKVGLIEWMKNTKPLKEFLKGAMEENEQETYQKATVWHVDWLKKKYEEKYQVMYKKANRTDVETQYRRKVACVPWDLLRRAFLQLSSSPEAFLTLRSHCIRTLGALTVCQYVLGIGDRHLSNFMVDLQSGGLIGIDFGHNFGTATQFLPYPELMPFRLTPQFTNLLLPHVESSQTKSSGQLRNCMVHSLRALRNSSQLLLNMMDVFVKEPALDWKSFARKQAKTQRKNKDAELHEGTWYPREKIHTAKKKLHGHNPAHVMLVDLKNGHEKTQEFPALKAILMGDKKWNKRAQVGERCMTVEEQVACLVDHATDPNILGRTWAGWEPWV